MWRLLLPRLINLLLLFCLFLPVGAELEKYQSMSLNSLNSSDLKISETQSVKARLRNELGQSVAVKMKMLDRASSTKEFYLSAYETFELGTIRSGSYELVVYSLMHELLGKIIADVASSRDSLISVNRFNLSLEEELALPALAVEDLQEELPELNQGGSRLIESQASSAALRVAELEAKPEPPATSKSLIAKQDNSVIPEQLPVEKTEANTQYGINLQSVELQEQSLEFHKTSLKKIKVANLSEFSVHINIKQVNGEMIGTGWTIGNNLYKPEALLYKGEEVSLSNDSYIEVQFLTQEEPAHIIKTINKKASELNFDTTGDYIWIID